MYFNKNSNYFKLSRIELENEQKLEEIREKWNCWGEIAWRKDPDFTWSMS